MNEAFGHETRDVSGWFALRTKPRHERIVAAQLSRRGVENYLPLIPCRRQWSDRTKTILLPAFPNYVLARHSETQVGRLRALPGVRYVVSSDGRPSRICEEELSNVKRMVAAFERAGFMPVEQEVWDIEPPPLNEGDIVRVKSGIFAGVQGQVSKRCGVTRLIVTVTYAERWIVLNVDAGSLERLTGCGLGPGI